jgi:CheY-like chemotaxis protein
VSSKEGDGSTFGFFFKVRRSDGSSVGDGRPPFASRTSSENPTTPNQPARTPRPGYSRANSNLQDIKERSNEQGRKEIKLEAKESVSESESKKDDATEDGKRPGLDTLTSHSGVDTDNVDPSLKDPPTEYFPEAHPESNEDQRYKETESVAKQVTPPTEGHSGRIPFSESGESERQEAAADKAHKAQSSQHWENKRTLLLVEDNLINQKVLRRQLQSRGFEVFIANNGQEAIDAVAERGKTAAEDQHNRDYFDCILMDQEMPIKDGNQATTEIRQLQDEGKAGYSKILGVSANVREAQQKSMRDAGMDDLISKPFKVDDLVKKIDGLTVGGKDGKGERGKLASEAKEAEEGVGLTKGEKESQQKEKQREEDVPGDEQQEQQERREDKQTEAREEEARDKKD